MEKFRESYELQPSRGKKRKPKRNKRNRVLRKCIISVIVLFIICFAAIKVLFPLFSDSTAAQFFIGTHSPDDIDLDHLYSPYAILLDLDTGEAVAEKNSQDKIYPASLTKIMTAVLAIENTEDLNQTVTVPYDIFPSLYEKNASMAGFQPEEEVTFRDLLYGMLLPSGAECCMSFAWEIAGSEEEFVDLMNKKAEELGMNNTHFSNATGLHNPEHYSTVGDISLLLQYALKNGDFRRAFTSSRYSVSPTNKHADGFTFTSTLFENLDSPEVTGGEIIGGKTGYTEEGGLCLASLAEIHDKEYILVTAKADGTHETDPLHILDAIDVYNQIGEKTADY